MSAAFVTLAFVLLLALAAGLARIVRGPTAADRMLAVTLFGTTGVGVLLLLAAGLHRPALVDVALVFVALATVAATAFARLFEPPSARGGMR